MSKLLINESPMQVQPQLAVLIGLNEAIFAQQLKYLLNSSKNVRDGEKWVYNTYSDWVKIFPFWSESTIKRVVKKLEDAELIITSTKYNRYKADKTKWYRLNEKSFLELETKILENQNDLPTGQNDQSLGSDWHDAQVKMDSPRTGQNDPTYDQETSNRISQERKSRKKEKIEILQFGEKVKLPLPAYEKLVAEFGELKIVEYIEKINTYLTTTEKGLKRGEYKNYAQTIRNWIGSDSNGSPANHSPQQAQTVAAWKEKAAYLSNGRKDSDWWGQPGEDNQTWAKRVVIWLKVGLDKHWDIERQDWRMETDAQRAMVRKLYFHARDILQGRVA